MGNGTVAPPRRNRERYALRLAAVWAWVLAAAVMTLDGWLWPLRALLGQ